MNDLSQAERDSLNGIPSASMSGRQSLLVSRPAHLGEQMKNFLTNLWKDEEGQDLTEYALLLVLLSLAAVGALSGLATAINGTFANATANLNT